MKNSNTNRVNMINAMLLYHDANVAATAGIPSFALVVGDVKAKMVLINSLNIVAGGTSTGVTLDTNKLRTTMEALALKCANATLAFANQNNDDTLKAKVNYTATKLARLKKEDADDVCEKIQIATNANIASVVNFGAVATDPADLLAAINLYRIASQNPRQAIVTKTQANANATKMIREVIDNLLLAQLDRMADTLKMTNLAFWNGWKQAREIIDLGSTTAKLRGTVKDEMDVPLSNVKLSIFKTGTATLVLLVVTDAKGRFNATDLPAGDFDFKWELKDYVTVDEANVHVAAGKELKRKVVMKKV